MQGQGRMRWHVQGQAFASGYSFFGGKGFGVLRQQVGSPVEAGGAQEAGSEVVHAAGFEQRVDAGLRRGIGGRAECARDRTEPQFEQAVPARRLEVILALGRCPRDQLDLSVIEAELLVDAPRLRLDGAVIWEQDSLRAALNDSRRDQRLGDVGEALRGEHHRDVLLAQDLEPFPDAGGEQRVVEEYPGLVEDEQRRAAVEPLLEARSEEHTSELQSLMRISYAVF